MSPRAAWRLESLGFAEVFDYVPGKADWFAYGLPMEGTEALLPRVGDVARQDLPRCGLKDRIGDIRRQVEAVGWDVCVVVNERDVVLGLLRTRELKAGAEMTAEQVMRSGPATHRPDALVSVVVDRLRQRQVDGVLITRSDGTLLGWLRREDVEKE